MNYLAHFHLAGDEPAMLGGALLGDFVKGQLNGQYHQGLERGIRLHRRIDAFSDSDRVLASYRRQLPPSLFRYSSIVTDVVFDFHLCRHWLTFHQQDLRQFTDTVYRVLASQQTDYPPPAQRFVQRMIEHDLLVHYGQWLTVDRVLKNIATRLPHDNPLHQGSAAIDAHRDVLQRAFFDFYPRVFSMARHYRSSASTPRQT